MHELRLNGPKQCFMYLVTGWPFVDLKNGRLAKQVITFLRLAGNVWQYKIVLEYEARTCQATKTMMRE